MTIQENKIKYLKIFVIFLLAFSGIVFFANISLAAKNWYVDKIATGANNGTSWANALTSFASVVWGAGGVSAGDTLYISGGSTSKTYTEQMHVGASGTDGNPITIRVGQDPGHNGEVILDYDASGDSGSGYAFWIYDISNLVINGSVGGARNLRIKNLRNPSAFFGYQIAAIGAGLNTNVTIRYITIENCANGIWANGGTNIEVDHNSIQVRGDAAITWFGDDAWDNILIHHNTFEILFNNVPAGNWGPDGIQAGSGASIYNNTFILTSTSVTTSSQHPDYLQITGNHLKIYNNDFVGMGDSAIDYSFQSNPTPHDTWIFNPVGFNSPKLASAFGMMLA